MNTKETMNKNEKKGVRYEVEGRYGYHAVDLYIDGSCRRTVITGISRKVAITVADEMNEAYRQGRIDQSNPFS